MNEKQELELKKQIKSIDEYIILADNEKNTTIAQDLYLSAISKTLLLFLKTRMLNEGVHLN